MENVQYVEIRYCVILEIDRIYNDDGDSEKAEIRFVVQFSRIKYS